VAGGDPEGGSVTASCWRLGKPILLSLALLATSPIAAQVPDAVFASAEIVRLAAGKDTRVAFEPAALVQVDVGGEQVSALPVSNEEALTQLNIYSFVVRGNDGAYKLLYPVVSILHASGAVIQTLKPRHEFKFAAAILTNEFDLPPDAKRLLIHTRKEYVESGFESNFGPPPFGTDEPLPAIAGIGAAAVGFAFPAVGLIVALGLLTRTKGVCTFGERGVIQLVAR
jgi:hypothetical protein